MSEAAKPARRSTQNTSPAQVASPAADYSPIDARTGPFLAAIAFFMSGGIAALINTNIRAAKFAFPDGTTIPLPLVLITCSLLLSGLSATSLILSLGPPEPPPLPAPEPAGQVKAGPGKADVRLPAPAGHVWYKYERIVEARATFFLALPFFLLGILTTAFVLASDASDRPQEFAWPISLYGSVIVALLTFVAGNDRARIESLGPDPRGDSRVFSALAMHLSVSAFLTFLAAGLGGYWWPVILVAAAFSVGLPGARVLAVRRKDNPADPNSRRALDSLRPVLFAALNLPALAVGLVPSWRPVLLLASLIPIVVFEGSRLVYGYAGITKRDYFRNQLDPATATTS